MERIVKSDADAPEPEGTESVSGEPEAEEALDSPVEVRDEGLLAVVEAENGEPGPRELPEEEERTPPEGSQDGGASTCS